MKAIKEKALIVQPKAADVARRIPQGIRHAAEMGHQQSDRTEQDQEGNKPEDQVSDAAQQSALRATDLLGKQHKRCQKIVKLPFPTKQVRSDRASPTRKSSLPSIQPRQFTFHSRTISTQMKSAHLLQSQKHAAKSMTRVTQSVSQKIAVSIKSFVTSIKSIGTIIAAGGWAAVAIIVLLALIVWILTTPAGIFAGGKYEDDPNRSVYTVLDELAKEVDNRIDAIIEEHGDGCEISIQYMNDKESILDQVGSLVLAVYAVKVSTDPTEPDQVMTLDARKETILRDIFWQAVLIDHKIHENTTTVSGGIKTTTRYLKITIEILTADQLINAMNLNQEQRNVVYCLLDSF